jgi:type VI secretion system protein ImpA
MGNMVMQPDVTANDMPIDRVIDEGVLSPIPGLRPAGEDIRGLKLWVDLRTARPRMDDLSADHDWTPANPVVTDWASYRDMVEQAICNRSKDLELGLFLTEASTRVFGFAGARDGLWMLSGLITGFRHHGLFPEPEDGDQEAQYGKLDWLNEKFSDVIREIPITRRPEPGRNYSLNYRDESRRQGGMITSAEFEAAAMAGTVEEYNTLLSEIVETRAELDRFKRLIVEEYGIGVLSFTLSDDTLEDCRVTVQGILRKLSSGGKQDSIKEPAAPVGLVSAAGPVVISTVAGEPTDAWSDCARMARSGNVDQALATMASLAAAEPNGRVRFQRKLLLADLCIQTNRKKLGTSILQELNEIIEQHKLENWETSEIVGGVWARLVRCYRDKTAGTEDEDREAEFFLKLSRLDPWQALACGEPVKKG